MLGFVADVELWVLVGGFEELGVLVPATVYSQVVGCGDIICEINGLEIMLLEDLP